MNKELGGRGVAAQGTGPGPEENQEKQRKCLQKPKLKMTPTLPARGGSLSCSLPQPFCRLTGNQWGTGVNALANSGSPKKLASERANQILPYMVAFGFTRCKLFSAAKPAE